MWNPSRLWRRKETLDRGEPNLFSLLLLLSFFFKGVYVSRLGPGERLTEVSGITSCIYNTTRVDPSRWCSVITPNKHTTTSPPYISLSLVSIGRKETRTRNKYRSAPSSGRPWRSRFHSSVAAASAGLNRSQQQQQRLHWTTTRIYIYVL